MLRCLERLNVASPLYISMEHTRGRPIIGLADIKHFTDIGHFKNRFADIFFSFFFLCKQTYYLQVTLFIMKK